MIGAAGVAGTEGRANFVEVLPVAAKDIADPRIAPPFIHSPYGVEESPLIRVGMPGATDTELSALCINPN